MGTKAIVFIIDENKDILATIYSQNNGYPDGIGLTLFNLLKNRKCVDGFTGETDGTVCYNGIEDIAATIVHELKKDCGIGGVYLYPHPKDYRNDSTEKEQEEALLTYSEFVAEYVYVITPQIKLNILSCELYITIYHYNDKIYNGLVNDMNDPEYELFF